MVAQAARGQVSDLGLRPLWIVWGYHCYLQGKSQGSLLPIL